MNTNTNEIPTKPPGMARPRRRWIETIWRGQGVWRYLWNERLLLLAVALTIPVLYLISLGWDWRRFLTWETLSTFGSVSALFVGFAIFLNEAVENAESRLEKRLSVYFLYPDQETTCVVCREATLAGEGDIRQWGQQLGLQICGAQLSFTPFVDIRRLGLDKDKRTRENFLHYQAVFRLRELPDKLKMELDQQTSNKGCLQAKFMKPLIEDERLGPVVIDFDAAENYPYER